MIRTSRRRVIAAAAFLIAAPALAGCAAGFDANTNRPYAPTEARVVNAKGIAISQAFLLGPEAGDTLAQGASAPLYLAMTNTNQAPDRLVGGTAEGVGTVRTPGPIDLPPDTIVRTAGAAGSAAGAAVVVDGLAKGLRGGEYVTVNLQFANAGTVPVSVPVIPRSREFSTFPPASPAAPSGDATPSPTPTGETTPETGAEGDPAASPSATPTTTGH